MHAEAFPTALRMRPGGQRPLRVLLLADPGRGQAPTVNEHVASLAGLSRHDVRLFNPRGTELSNKLSLDEFDVVVIHYSLMIISDQYLSPWFRDKIAEFQGLKVQFIQDEYRSIEDMWQMMRYLGIDLLFTLIPERELDKVYPESALPGVRKVTTLAGYVPEAARRFRTADVDRRPIDIGYRGRVVPPWLGILGQEKTWIAEGALGRAHDYGLRCDISWTENSRVYGRAWFKFVASCRVTLGTESGATISDFDGSIERRTRDYQAAHPDADFWDVHRAVLAPYEENVRINVISPRIFEAAALGTGLVLFPGEYSGILERDRHYIGLEKDFSNMDEVVAAIRDGKRLKALTSRTFAEIIQSSRYSYRAMVGQFDDLLDEVGQRRTLSAPFGFYAARAEQSARRIAARPQHAMNVTGGWVACLRLIAQDRCTRMLLTRCLLTRSVRTKVPLAKLWHDLVRLALLRRANTGRLTAGPDFIVDPAPHSTPSSRMIKSRHLGREHGSAQSAHVRRGADPGALTWDHGEVSTMFVVPLTRARWVSFPVSPRGGTPIYQFGAIHAVRSTLPSLVDRALEELSIVEREKRRSPAEVPGIPLPVRVREAVRAAVVRVARSMALARLTGLLVLRILRGDNHPRELVAAVRRGLIPGDPEC